MLFSWEKTVCASVNIIIKFSYTPSSFKWSIYKQIFPHFRLLITDRNWASKPCGKIAANEYFVVPRYHFMIIIKSKLFDFRTSEFMVDYANIIIDTYHVRL